MTTCAGCGASVDGLLCQACGRATPHVGDAQTERRALEELHGAAAKAGDEAAARLLTAGFLPSSKAVLIEAGLRCLALAGESSTYYMRTGAVDRLRAVSAKLRLQPQDAEAARALERFEHAVQAAEKNTRSDLAVFLAVCLLLLLLAGGTAALFLLRP
ncbi:MAG: hypothetical protein HY928_03490 [Elusimicrobia bacterium]|nr:hypothetical protein [Elusimicrobiota bacterium]